jgi:hypothetical protein
MPEEIKGFFEEHSKPLIISIVTAVLTFASTWGATQSKVQDLQRQIDQQHAEYVTRNEFSQFTNGNNERLNDLKVLMLSLRETSREISDRQVEARTGR